MRRWKRPVTRSRDTWSIFCTCILHCILLFILHILLALWNERTRCICGPNDTGSRCRIHEIIDSIYYRSVGLSC